LVTSNISYNSLTNNSASFSLLRTNPKLTSNLKITIDSNDNLWFNSINSTSELAQSKYKNIPINEDSNHEVNVFTFFDDGKTPSKISFAIGSTITTGTVADDLKDQYDFDLYSSGAKYLKSKEYIEKFSYLAPLYIDSILPEYFIILKIPGASNYTVGEWKQKILDPTFSNSKFAIDLFKKAELVKAIKLGEDSKIGKYIRNIQNNPMFNNKPLYVNFKENKYSVYRGISISTGTYVEIPELLSPTLRSSIPQLKLEKYITEGFERNNLIYPNILNLEFLFNDDSSDTYSINRYIGFYCNLIDLVKFNIDIDSMYLNIDNDNPLPNKFNETDEISLNITNKDGVVLRGIGIDSDLSEFSKIISNYNNIFFPFLKTKDGNLHFPKIQTLEQYNNTIKFKLSDKSFDLGQTFGAGKLFSQETAKPSSIDSKSTILLTIDTILNHLDTIRLYHENGYTYDKTDKYGKYDDLIFIDDELNTIFPNNEKYIIDYPEITNILFNTSNPNLGSTVFSPNSPSSINTQYVSSINNTKWIWNGSEYIEEVLGSIIYINLNTANSISNKVTDINQLALTIKNIISNLKSSYLTALTYNNNIFIQVKNVGNYYNQLSVRLLDSAYSRISINGKHTQSIVIADGGFSNTKYAIVSIENLDRLSSNLNDLVVKTTNWSKVARISHCSTFLNKTQLCESDITTYLTNGTLMLCDNEPIDVKYDVIEIREIFKPTLGILSLFEIKDIDFYTYSSQYSKIPEIDLYHYYWVPPNTKILNFDEYVYSLVGQGTIEVNGIQYSTSNTSTIWQNITGLHKYTIIDGNPLLVKSNIKPNTESVLRQDVARLDEDNNLSNFTGFFALGADHSIPNPDLPTYTYREKYKTNNLLSEYHVYLENFNKEFSVEGRVVPYISKWGILDSFDSRNNPYRLNSDIMFGENNFGPSHRETKPTAEKLTHEWFYIESDFEYTDSEDLLKKNYCYFNEPFDVNKMISDSSYFLEYFTYIPKFNGNEIDRTQFRYSKLKLDSFTKQYSTIFNGVKINFAELGENGIERSNTNRFDNYLFSILLKPIPEKTSINQNPIKYRVIENIDAKAIVLLIELPIGYKEKINARLLEDTIYNTISGNTLQFPDRRLDQTNIFIESLSSMSNINSTKFQVDWIYTTENSVSGDQLFTDIINSSYISFSNLDFLNGTAINGRTGESLTTYIPKNNELVLIQKGSDLTSQILIAFEESTVYKMASTGELISGAKNLVSTDTQYLLINLPKNGYLQTSGSLFRIIEDSNNTNSQIELTANNELILSLSNSGFLSMLGDYRLNFNENTVSNLTYNFLYAAKDKKYNTTKSSYSTIKLAIGVDLSSNSFNSNYYLNLKQVKGLNIKEFKFEDFVNVLSNSHDTFENSEMINSIKSSSDPEISSPLPSFSPLMFLNTLGEVSFLLGSSADFSKTDNEIKLQLINPKITNDAISKVNGNLIILDNTLHDIVVLKCNFTADPITGPKYSIIKENYPTQTPSYWLNDNVQFQLFGGRNYFSNLFESLSLANFILLLENKSNLISWESYENGSLSNDQKISIQIEEGDLINKSTIVKLDTEIVSTESATSPGGITHTEKESTKYELFRYSGEYDIITRPISAFIQYCKVDDYVFNGTNSFLNTNVSNFFTIPEFSFVKYSNFKILELESSDKFEPVYPMIYESPIDFDSFFTLSSSWDFNYHYKYSSKKDKTKIPGTNRIVEDYSFVSKLINLPDSFIVESFNFENLTNSDFNIKISDFLKLENEAGIIDFVVTNKTNSFDFKINFSRALVTALTYDILNGENRLKSEFEKFFVDQNSLPIISDQTALGELTLNEYIYEYCKYNILPLYELIELDFYVKDNRDLSENEIVLAQVPYSLLSNLGYSKLKSIKINNKNSDIITGSILKKSSTGITLVPKLKIKYI